MKLIRFAFIYLYTNESDWIERNINLNLSDVQIKINPIHSIELQPNIQLLLASAVISLTDSPEISSDNELIIPIEKREMTERAIMQNPRQIAQ